MKKFILTSLALVFTITLTFAQQAETSKKGDTFGDKVNAKGAISMEKLSVKMKDSQEMPLKVTGKVAEVCTKKGCWMKVEAANGLTTMVTFKDYAFFMPKDIVGKTIVMDGIAKQSITTVADQKHYAEDAKKSKEEIAKITSPKKEIKYEAKGVMIL